MAVLYKLTDPSWRTRCGCSNETLWGPRVKHEVSGVGTQMCTSDVIHAYRSPLLALLVNPIHANIRDPVLWLAEGEPVAQDGLKVGVKAGVKALTTVEVVVAPALVVEVHVRFAILAARCVCHDASWLLWAENWLSGEDRDLKSAHDAWSEALRRGLGEASAKAAWAAASLPWKNWSAVAAAEAVGEAAQQLGVMTDFAQLAEDSLARGGL